MLSDYVRTTPLKVHVGRLCSAYVSLSELQSVNNVKLLLTHCVL